MSKKSIFVVSPPFYSHFKPLMSIAKSFKRQGARVTVACSLDFQTEIEEHGLSFYEWHISANKNTGNASLTEQSKEEKERLDGFFKATKKGAVETLIFQAEHRQKDMFHDPDGLIERLDLISKSNKVDLYVVDILSYGVTLALYILDCPFVTFCPPHPHTIPKDARLYGVPTNWSKEIYVNTKMMEVLEEKAKETQVIFTNIYNEKIKEHGGYRPQLENAFNHQASIGIIYNYPNFIKKSKANEDRKLEYYIGHAFEEEYLSPFWLDKVQTPKKKVMITLGTFLSNRLDVMKRILLSVKKYDSDTVLYVNGGQHVDELMKLAGIDDYIEAFIPQKGLMPYMDLVIHHGGNNTFTECLFYDKPMIILPFSSDQFNVAYDAQKEKLAFILDPNHFSKQELINALKGLDHLDKPSKYAIQSRERGPDYATKDILQLIQ